MEQKKHYRSLTIKDYKYGIYLFIAAIAICLLIFSISAQQAIEKNSQTTMMNNLSQQSEHLRTILGVHYQYLRSAAQEIGESDDLLCDENMQILSALYNNTTLARVAIIEKDGTAHYDNGKEANVAQRRYFQEAIAGKQTLSDPLESKLDQETKVILGVPIYHNNEIVGVLSGSYDVTSLSRMLFNDTFGGIGYTLIVTKDGEIIAYDGDSAYHHITYGDNFFDFYSGKTLLDGASFESVKQDFTIGCKGIIKMQNPGFFQKKQYLAYAPLKTNGWMVCYVIPVSTAQESYRFIMTYELFLLISFIILVVLLTLYMVRKENIQNRRLLYYAQTDALTHVYNKKTTEDFINQHLKTCDSNMIQAFLIMDIDKFKSVNDTYGHVAGDAVLKLFGQLLRTNFRKEDVIGRIGGDEFVVLLKNLNAKEETNAHIEHLISKIREQYIDEIEGKITISMGICFAPENGSTFMDLYRCADRALYQTKQNGRDGYTFYTKK